MEKSMEELVKLYGDNTFEYYLMFYRLARADLAKGWSPEKRKLASAFWKLMDRYPEAKWLEFEL